MMVSSSYAYHIFSYIIRARIFMYTKVPKYVCKYVPKILKICTPICTRFYIFFEQLHVLEIKFSNYHVFCCQPLEFPANSNEFRQKIKQSRGVLQVFRPTVMKNYESLCRPTSRVLVESLNIL